MLTAKEKRFLKYWEEQRTGGRWQYYLLYILVGTFIMTIGLAFLYSLWFSPVFDYAGLTYIGIVSFLLVMVITMLTWQRNEKKFKDIVRREIREGKQQDDKISG